MISTLIVSIHLVVFLLNRKAGVLLITCLCAEYVGWAEIFSWSAEIYYGALMHLIWGMIYASYVLLEKLDFRLLKLCGVMVLFQLIMSVDCLRSSGHETYLFILYKYILVVLHCCIVSTFISGRKLVTLLDNITSAFRGISTHYGFSVGFWYNKANQKN